MATRKKHKRRIKGKKLKLRKLMSALENLTASVSSLTTAVDSAVTTLKTPHPTDSQVQAAADAINSQVARLNDAVNPPTTSETAAE